VAELFIRVGSIWNFDDLGQYQQIGDSYYIVFVNSNFIGTKIVDDTYKTDISNRLLIEYQNGHGSHVYIDDDFNYNVVIDNKKYDLIPDIAFDNTYSTEQMAFNDDGTIKVDINDNIIMDKIQLSVVGYADIYRPKTYMKGKYANSVVGLVIRGISDKNIKISVRDIHDQLIYTSIYITDDVRFNTTSTYFKYYNQNIGTYLDI